MKNKITILIITFTVIAVLAVTGFYLISKSPAKPTKKRAESWNLPTKPPSISKQDNNKKKQTVDSIKKTEVESTKTDTVKTSTSTVQSKPKTNPSNKKDSNDYQTTNKNVTKLITVKLNINTGQDKLSYNVSVKENSTVYDVLKTSSKEHNFSLKVTEYSYGIFVEEIAGVANNPDESTYWLYYINGKLANVGSSSQKVKKGDDVLWNYEKT